LSHCGFLRAQRLSRQLGDGSGTTENGGHREKEQRSTFCFRDSTRRVSPRVYASQRTAGAGVVDEKHKIYVLLFDANPFTSSSLIDATSQPTLPAAAPGVSHILVRQGAAATDVTLTFEKLSAPSV